MASFPVLRREDLPLDPTIAMTAWMDEAGAHPGIDDARTACLATADPDASPDARMIIVRDIGPEGLLVYTSLASAKAGQLDAVGRAAVVLFWEPLMRQLRVRGDAVRLTDEEADDHFARRPRPNRIAAWASDQAEHLGDRDELEARFADVDGRFDDDVPRPDTWGGYRVVPDEVELWQGHPDTRIHDRFRYQRSGDGWRLDRIAP